MDEDNSLLNIWELTQADLEDDKITTLLKSFSFSNRTEDFQTLKFCNNCFASNSEDANWCIECGTAIIKSPASEEHYSVQEPKQQKLSQSDLHAHNTVIKTPDCSSIAICADPGDRQTTLDSPISDVLSLPPATKQCKWFGEDYNEVQKYEQIGIQENRLLLLPSEVLLRILSYLTHSDLCKCMLVSRRLNILSRDPSLWKKIKLRKIRNLDGSMLKQIAERCPRYFSMIDCHGHIPTCDIIDFFSTGGRNIEMLHMELTELGTYSTDAFLQSAAKYCSKLHSVSLNWISISEKTIQLCNSLKELCVRNKALTVGTLQAISSFHKYQIRKLDIESTKIEDALAAFNSNTMPALEHFSATFSELSDRRIIHQMMQMFPKMKSLCACAVRQPDVIGKELSKYPLQCLHFKQFGKGSRSYFFIRSMTTLRSLSIDSIEDDGLLVLCQGKLQLQTLDLSGSGVTTK